MASELGADRGREKRQRPQAVDFDGLGGRSIIHEYSSRSERKEPSEKSSKRSKNSQGPKHYNRHRSRSRSPTSKFLQNHSDSEQERSRRDHKKDKRGHDDDDDDRRHRHRRRRHSRSQAKDYDSDKRDPGNLDAETGDGDESRHKKRRHKSHRRRDKSRDRERSISPSSKNSDRENRHRHRHHRRHESRDRASLPPSPSIPEKVATFQRSNAPLPDQNAAFTATTNPDGKPDPPKERPNYAPSGLLAAATNTVTLPSASNSSSRLPPDEKKIVLKYHEPPDAKLPPHRAQGIDNDGGWRLYVFKPPNNDPLITYPLYKQTSWLIGREENGICAIEAQHPSISKQHAVLQFREKAKPASARHKDNSDGLLDIDAHTRNGLKRSRVRLYFIDLESANGSSLNGEKVPGGRYVEVRNGDVLRLGHSEREYVIVYPPST